MTREDAINQIISSVAMEELGLSHILNAEGEKLQFVLGTLEGSSGLNPTLEELLKINESVQRTLSTAMQNQMFLQNKMTSALNAPVMEGPAGPAGPTGPAGESVMVVPAYDAAAAPKYAMGQMIMSGGKVYVVIDTPPYGEPGASEDYALLGGGDDANNDDGDDDGEVELLFSSGEPMTLAVAPLGAAGAMSCVGDDSAESGDDILGNPFTLPVADDTVSVTVKANGTLDSLNASFETDAGASAPANPVTVYAELYYAAPGSDTFDPVPASGIELEPPQPAESAATSMSGSASAIGFPVTAGGRLLLAYNTTSGMTSPEGTLDGTASAVATII